MNDSSIRSQVDMLRARVESELSTPAVLVVTSAKRGDGKSLVAHGLAETFAEARYRVLLVDANAANPEIPDLPKVTRLDGGFDDKAYPIRRLESYEALSLTDPRLASATPREAVEATTAWLRARYDVVIVDAAPVGASTLALLFAGCADATLLALRLGRRAGDEDAATIGALERINARVLGVVATTAAAARTFAKREREPARPAMPSLVTAGTMPFVETITGDDRTRPARGRVSAEAS